MALGADLSVLDRDDRATRREMRIRTMVVAVLHRHRRDARRLQLGCRRFRGARLRPLGESLIDPRSRELPRLATVFADRVATLADGSPTSRERLLAWAMAHEIGHLLLNTTQHSKRGLMRASWSQAELGRRDPRDWTFSKPDVRALRSAMASRSALAEAQIPNPKTQIPNSKG